MDDIKSIFAKNLNRIMEVNNKTQTNLIDDLGLNKSTISTWCNGTKMPRMNAINMLANYFDVEVSDLLEEQQQAPLPTECILLARKVGDVPIDKRDKVLKILDSTIDSVLSVLDEEDN